MIKNNQKGFIALFSVIIISFVLLLMTITANFSGFSGRFNIFDSENKERSNELADACIEEARLEIALNNSYTVNNEELEISANEYCIYDVNIFGSDKEIISHSCINKAETFYRAEVDDDMSNIPITLFEELPSYAGLSTCP